MVTQEMLFNDMYFHESLWTYFKVIVFSAFVVWAMINASSRVHKLFGGATTVTLSAVGLIMLYTYLLAPEVRLHDNLMHFSELVGVFAGVFAGVFLQPSWPRRWRDRFWLRVAERLARMPDLFV